MDDKFYFYESVYQRFYSVSEDTLMSRQGLTQIHKERNLIHKTVDFVFEYPVHT